MPCFSILNSFSNVKFNWIWFSGKKPKREKQAEAEKAAKEAGTFCRSTQTRRYLTIAVGKRIETWLSSGKVQGSEDTHCIYTVLLLSTPSGNLKYFNNGCLHILELLHNSINALFHSKCQLATCLDQLTQCQNLIANCIIFHIYLFADSREISLQL